jgi:hypothetical protein
LNRFYKLNQVPAPDGIRFELKNWGSNDPDKDGIVVVPVEYKNKYPDINRPTDFTFTTYRLPDLSISIDDWEKAIADSEEELENKIVSAKGDKFGQGPWPYRTNPNLLKKKDQDNIKSIAPVLEQYGILIADYFAKSSKLKELSDKLWTIRQAPAPKKSLFNSKYKKYANDYANTLAELEKTECDKLHKKSSTLIKEV